MSITTVVIVLALTNSAAAREHSTYPADDSVLATGGQLLSWCELEARAHFAGQGVETYQWTGRHFERGNTLHAEGRIRANGEEVAVACSVAKGARAHDAMFRILAEEDA